MIARLLIFACCMTVLVACQTEPKVEEQPTKIASGSVVNQMSLKHATGFGIEYYDSYKLLTIYNPWNNFEPLRKYALVERGTSPKIEEEVHAQIETPIERIAVLSTSHIGMLEALDLGQSIVGVGDAQYINSPDLLARIDHGEVSSLGTLEKLNLEVAIDLDPALVMVSGFEHTAGATQKVDGAGIPVMINVEWKEKTPLARAEWLKFFAAFYNEEAKADSLFNAIEGQYNTLKSLVTTATYQPQILSGRTFKDTWHVPGGESYLAILLRDAGATYPWVSDTTTGSIPLSLEEVMESSLDAEIWIMPGTASTLEELAAADERYQNFTAFDEGEVYNYTARVSPNGGNDYWESGVAQPHTILADLIAIFHPDLLPDHQLYYFQQLQ